MGCLPDPNAGILSTVDPHRNPHVGNAQGLR
jgi:hypothetical protein